MNPPFVGWNRVNIQKRPDIIGVRTLDSGQREFLVHNEAFCTPYYTLKELKQQE